MDNLSEKPCRCGDTMGEIIRFNHRCTDDAHVPYRDGWYCSECHAVEKAIGRETFVEIIHDKVNSCC